MLSMQHGRWRAVLGYNIFYVFASAEAEVVSNTIACTLCSSKGEKYMSTKTATLKTVKRNGIVYALITPSTLTSMKNRLKKAKAAAVAAPSEFPKITKSTVPGTTGTVFTVVAQNGERTVAFRPLGYGEYRVRVNTEAPLKPLAGWTQPSSEQKRHSIVVNSVDGLLRAVALGTFAIFNS